MTTRFSLMMGSFAALLVASCGGERRSSNPGPIDPDAPAEFTTTDSGLKYRILRKSDGPQPTVRDSVTVDYVGKLESNLEFDNSYLRPEPTTFVLTNVIEGWQEGLQLVGEGGMIELKVPPELGYGAQGVPGSIPPNSTLIFRIELHEVQSMPRAP